MPDKRMLNEVVLIRVVLAILIVLYHSFVCFEGKWAWPFDDAYMHIGGYEWVSWLSYAFVIEGFVFAAGYIFHLQKGKYIDARGGGWKLLLNKLKRLIVPSIIFSVLYVLLFRWSLLKNGWKAMEAILQGSGHLWFLPMLFWCFMLVFFVARIKVKEGYKMAVLALLSLLSVVNFPLRLDKAFYYLPFFYFGFLMFRYRDRIREKLSAHKLLILWLQFILCFLLYQLWIVDFSQLTMEQAVESLDYELILPTLCEFLMRQIYAVAGVFALYSTCLWIAEHRAVGRVVLQLGACSFGIYLLQQFILKFMHIYTPLPEMMGVYALPWLSFVAVLAISFFLSKMLRKTSTGRFLLG